MTELELCQLSQRALAHKLNQVEKLSKSRLTRLKSETKRRQELEKEVAHLKRAAGKARAK